MPSQELGRLAKTLYLLRFIDDESYRRILVQLNRGEGRHQLARIIFRGKRGELRQRYRERQEDQLGALGLVVNIVVLWSTIYMDAAPDQLRAEGFDVRPEDVARLSPLGFKHINMLGRYAFTLPDTVARGELRPLRDPKRSERYQRWTADAVGTERMLYAADCPYTYRSGDPTIETGGGRGRSFPADAPFIVHLATIASAST